ncbi:hypothetical protein [Pseudorhodoferax soli]|uniref:Diguanylate cyclase n=1 Tax=Pseudorhodoferax soli TaxID=545864 RepID=A0A368XQQ2_9BURK|nr:hypothetical protein [Pseudorhodoferax soli]RCW70342.1 hypothetical protein DES41_105284 [Pseudorhodoferax soli]
MTPVDNPALALWMVVVLPLWVAAGFLDWCCHRRTAIERTGGVRESSFHLAMFAQMGGAALMGLLLEPTVAVLAIFALLIATHELTVWLELRFVVGRRAVAPFEQMVHSFLEVLPVAGLLLLALASAASGGGVDGGEGGLRWRRHPLPGSYLAALIGAVLLLNVGPLLEELWRCVRHRRAGTGP